MSFERSSQYNLIGYKLFLVGIKGKQVKDYIIGDVLTSYHEMQLLSGQTIKGRPISILMIDKKQMEQASFLDYLNLLQQDNSQIFPRYYEPVQSSNNIYIILEHLNKIQPTSNHYKDILSLLLQLYLNVGEYKLEEEEIFLTDDHRLVYLPFYKRIHTTSKFYAQFHNKSILGQLFAKITPLQNHNKVLQIFIQNVDLPKSYDVIIKLIDAQMLSNNKPPAQYPSLQIYSNEEEVKDDEEILKLMSEAKVNTDMKKQAGDIYKRQSVKRFQNESEKEMHQILELAKSSMPTIKQACISQHLKTKIQVKLNVSKVEGNQFHVYFKSYIDTLRFLKRSIKVFLEHYRNGFSGIIAAYLILAVLTLRKAYAIRDLQSGQDIFQLDINMSKVPINKYKSILTRQLKSEAKMLAQLRILIQNCQMPVKTYHILGPYLESDLSLIQLEQLQTFTFFFLSALMKGRHKAEYHFLFFVEVMYIMLHKHYEIVFFESDFPTRWDELYFDTKVALIQAILPNWRLE